MSFCEAHFQISLKFNCSSTVIVGGGWSMTTVGRYICKKTKEVSLWSVLLREKPFKFFFWTIRDSRLFPLSPNKKRNNRKNNSFYSLKDDIRVKVIILAEKSVSFMIIQSSFEKRKTQIPRCLETHRCHRGGRQTW